MPDKDAAFAFANAEDRPLNSIEEIPQMPVPAPPQSDFRARAADLTKEFVSGGGYIFVANYIRSLPLFIDDITRDFGEDLYERMLIDAQVKKCIRVYKLAILSDDLQVRLPKKHDKKKDQYFDDAKAFAEFCEAELERLELETNRSIEAFLFEMLDCMALGNKIAEQVYRIEEEGKYAGYLVLDRLKTKVRRATAFVVDSFENTIGIMGLIPGQGFPVLQGTIVGDPARLPNLLPREKFCVASWDTVNNDPRGVSILRSAYVPWWNKMQDIGLFLKFKAQWSVPSLFGTTPEDAQISPNVDGLGNPQTQPNNQGPLTPEMVLLNQILQFQSGTAMVAPFGTEVKPISPGNATQDPFLKSLEYWNSEIANTILLQQLATEQAQYDTEGAAGAHQDIFALNVKYGKKMMASMVRRDLFHNWIRFNYGHEAAALLTPVPSLTPTEHQDWVGQASAVANLHSVEYLADEQYEATDERLGLPARTTPPIRKSEIEAQTAQLAAANKPPPGGEGSGGGEGAKKPPPAPVAPPAKPKEPEEETEPKLHFKPIDQPHPVLLLTFRNFNGDETINSDGPWVAGKSPAGPINENAPDVVEWEGTGVKGTKVAYRGVVTDKPLTNWGNEARYAKDMAEVNDGRAVKVMLADGHVMPIPKGLLRKSKNSKDLPSGYKSANFSLVGFTENDEPYFVEEKSSFVLFDKLGSDAGVPEKKKRGRPKKKT